MNTTITFFSRTGHTRLIAESMVDVLNANLVSIQPRGSQYLGVFSAYVKGSMQATFGIGSLYDLSAPIPPDTDLLVIGERVSFDLATGLKLTPSLYAGFMDGMMFGQIPFYCRIGFGIFI